MNLSKSGFLVLNARSLTANNTINSKSFDESKVTLIFCSVSKCDFFGHGWQECYCCPDGSRKEYCHQTREECRANCALCGPKCYKPVDVTINATLYKQAIIV
ncbi:hypothetical protein PVAP13_9NG295773 [Panicum virgatum]|uniref:Uncharacterized protein n=1 Tax=Panicum virgatum TaxID=38727 RepID=A0A8T0MJ60_PANVG|nr:hypothetical protein PVAP13_9NG295773 [Panicum virgatum]